MKNCKALIYGVLVIFIFMFAGYSDSISGQQQPELRSGGDSGSFLHGPAAEERFKSLIVKYKEKGVVKSSLINRMSRFGSVRSKVLNRLRSHLVLDIDGDGIQALDLMSRIEEDPDVEYVEPNYIMRAFAVPNDPYYQYQWNMIQLNITEAWNMTMGSANVKVAVIDTGVVYDIDDLSSTQFDLVNDKDYADNDSDAYDENGHGTHVTGTIAQSTNNGTGAVGMAPGVTILPVRVLNALGTGDVADISDAIMYAADKGAHIINLSLGGGDYTETMNSACRYAYEKGVTIFAASGNDGEGTVSYPAAYDNYVIAVGATRYDMQKTSYSNYGSSLDIMAPGGDTSVDQNGDGYDDGILQQTIRGWRYFYTDYTTGYYYYQGTSMACPHAVGLAALLKSYNFNATPAQIREAMQNTAIDLGSSGRDNSYGYGLINPVAALNYIGGSTPEPDPVTNDTFNGTYSIIALHSGKALDTWEWGTVDGTNIAQFNYWGGESQQYVISQVDGIWHRITPVIAAGQAFDVPYCSFDDGANIQTWSYLANTCQQFRFQREADGVWRIINRNSEMCIEVLDGSTDDGANVVQSAFVSGANYQMFELVEAGTTEPEECEDWTATNDDHVSAGRAYTVDTSEGCDTITTYYAVGSDEEMGTSGNTTTTLYSNDGEETYHIGSCP